MNGVSAGGKITGNVRVIFGAVLLLSTPAFCQCHTMRTVRARRSRIVGTIVGLLGLWYFECGQVPYIHAVHCLGCPYGARVCSKDKMRCLSSTIYDEYRCEGLRVGSCCAHGHRTALRSAVRTQYATPPPPPSSSGRRYSHVFPLNYQNSISAL